MAWDAFSKYKVHPESNAMIELLVAKKAQPFSSYKSIAEARAAFLDVCIAGGGDVKFDGLVQELKIPSPYSKDGIPVTVYRPSKVAANPAIFIYIHGGGLILFERKCFDSALKKIATEASCIIINVEYRRLPDEGKGYGPFDDCGVVTKWVLENKKAVGGQPGSKVGVGGDSSGGQIAISVAGDVSGVDFLVAIYPVCDTSLSKPSIKEFAQSPVLPECDLKWFVEQIINDLPDQKNDPRICPFARKNLKSIPPALIIYSELDPLKDGAVEFINRLKELGVQVKSVEMKGVPHIFFGMCAVFPTVCAEAYREVAQYVQQFQ